MKKILVDAWNTFFIAEGIFQEMYDLLEKYPNPKIIVTNADDEQLIKYGIDKSPYEVFTLKHNPDKANPLYFQKLFEQFELKAEDIIYFDNNIEAVESAQSVGIKTFHYDKEKRDLVALKQFLEDNL